MIQDDREYLAALLEEGPKYDFRNWPNELVPDTGAGTYTVWLENELVYVGKAGREEGGKKSNLRGRLTSHARGTRGGDQFCLAVFDYYVLPDLTPDEIEKTKRQIEKIESYKQFLLDQLTKDFIRQKLSYRFVEVPDCPTASRLEDMIKKNKRPLLNRM